MHCSPVFFLVRETTAQALCVFLFLNLETAVSLTGYYKDVMSYYYWGTLKSKSIVHRELRNPGGILLSRLISSPIPIPAAQALHQVEESGLKTIWSIYVLERNCRHINHLKVNCTKQFVYKFLPSLAFCPLLLRNFNCQRFYLPL